MRRVVVTGLGIVNSLGVGINHNWENILASKSGIGAISSFDVSDLPAKIAGQIPMGETADGNFKSEDWVSSKDQRRMDDFPVGLHKQNNNNGDLVFPSVLALAV